MWQRPKALKSSSWLFDFFETYIINIVGHIPMPPIINDQIGGIIGELESEYNLPIVTIPLDKDGGVTGFFVPVIVQS